MTARPFARNRWTAIAFASSRNRFADVSSSFVSDLIEVFFFAGVGDDDDDDDDAIFFSPLVLLEDFSVWDAVDAGCCGDEALAEAPIARTTTTVSFFVFSRRRALARRGGRERKTSAK